MGATEKQWFWTKLVGSLLALFLLMSSGIGAANMHFDLKRDVVRNEAAITEHKSGEEKKWTKAWDNIEKNRDSIHKIEVSTADIRATLKEMSINQERMLDKLDNLQRTE